MIELPDTLPNIQPSLDRRRWALTVLAGVILAALISTNLLVWPIEYLGYDIDPLSGQITRIDPHSVAAQAGMQRGDQLIQLYGHPWREALTHWNRWSLIMQSGPTIQVLIERDGDHLTLTLPRQLPTPAHQVGKVVFALLGSVCWLTGALLGLVRRHEVNAFSLVAVFWLLLGGVLGTYIFAADLSLPLLVVQLWLLTTLLPALAVGIHVWFPARAVQPVHSKLVWRAMIAYWCVTNAALGLIWLLMRPTLITLMLWAWLPLVVVFSVAFFGSGLLLVRTYRRVAIAHVRRQIRLIGSACLITAVVWIALRVVPLLVGVPTLLFDALIDLTPLLIPLAYLVSGAGLRLYALDRLVARVVAFTLAGAALSIVAVTWRALAPGNAHLPVWSAVASGLLLVPLARRIHRLILRDDTIDRSYGPLRVARHQLTTSLEPQVLHAAIEQGIRNAFHGPPFALYQSCPDDSQTLSLVHQHDLADLPATIPDGELRRRLLSEPPITEAFELHAALRPTTLLAEEEAAVRHQGVALWCTIGQPTRSLYGVILIGTAGNLDPYRARDRLEIQELLDAAMLAFANSAAFERQRATESQLRELLHAMRQVEDETAAALSREVHDDILNGYLQLNIVTLQDLVGREADYDRRAELELLLESECGISANLRRICERLHPSGLDDPYGLLGLLRGQIERIQRVWPGSCQLISTGEPLPIMMGKQREIFRIAREALANAVKHASATTISLTVCYPDTSNGSLILEVADDGQTGQVIRSKAGHWGVSNMEESAIALGGELQFVQRPSCGTRVILETPLS